MKASSSGLAAFRIELNSQLRYGHCLDQSMNPPQRFVFEPAPIPVITVAEKFGAFIPQDIRGRTECLSWLFWGKWDSAPNAGWWLRGILCLCPAKNTELLDQIATLMEGKRSWMCWTSIFGRETVRALGMLTAAPDMGYLAVGYGGVATRGRFTSRRVFFEGILSQPLLRWVEGVGQRSGSLATWRIWSIVPGASVEQLRRKRPLRPAILMPWGKSDNPCHVN